VTDRLYLEYVQTRIERIARFTEDGREAFLHDEKTQDAGLRNLHMLAESTQGLSAGIKARYADIDTPTSTDGR
jgi:uncharacterized protein with HEPN domain